jgi:glycosyltransferase involved in cell wall biosynthesis
MKILKKIFVKILIKTNTYNFCKEKYYLYKKGHKSIKNHIDSEHLKDLKKNDFITDNETIIQYIYSKSNKYINKNKINVCVFPENFISPSYYIRLFSPLKELSKTGKFKFFIHDNLLDISKINHKCFDIIIIQRSISLNLKNIIKKCEEYDIKIIYETDDDLINLPKEHVDYINYKHRIENIEFLAKNSSLIIVSTPILKKRYEKYNKNISVIKNHKIKIFSNKNNRESVKIESNDSNNKKIKIGYFGGDTHQQDLLILKKPIENLKKKELNFQFEVLGTYKEKDLKKYGLESLFNILEYPTDDNTEGRFLNFKDFMKLLKKVAKWDIGVCPLIENEFNNGKSELKYIEYTSLEIPSVSSNVEVYSLAITDGYNGFLASTPEQWEEKLERLINSKQLREEILNNAILDVEKNYSLKNTVRQWEKILNNIV